MPKHQHHNRPGVTPEERRQAARNLVVYLSALFFALASLCPASLLLAKLCASLGIGPVLKGIDLVIVLILLPAMYVVCLMASLSLWMVVMSFYLTVEEWQSLDATPSLYIPGVTPVLSKVSDAILAWKIAREKRRQD